jgi:cholesterol transport system auxiliary component
VPYAGSEWVMSTAALLTQRLRTAVAGSAGAMGRSPAPAAASGYVLRAELLQFEQIFDEPHKSRGVLLLHATLDRNGRAERRTFEIEKSAPSPDAAGGARALSLCSDELVALISQWVVQQQRSDVS